MSNRHIEYLSAKKVKKIKANYILLIGERSNGKSYCVKSICIKSAYENKKLFVYLKRYDLEVKDSLCVAYFADMPVQELTNGEYTTIDVFRKGIYLANIDPETGKAIRGQKIGLCHSLSGAEHYKSLQFPDVENIIYEEIISQKGEYLYREADQLQHYISSIFRNTRTGKVYMIGNKLSRMCPYYKDWGLTRVPKQKNDSVDFYTMKNDNGPDTILAVYLTASLNTNTGMFFGKAADNITKGGYETEPQPRLPGDVRDYAVLHTVVLQHENVMYLLELLEGIDGYVFWYVQPKTTPIQDDTRVISKEFSANPLHSFRFRGLSEKEDRAFQILIKGKVCFSDDLTGTEFKGILPKYLVV